MAEPSRDLDELLASIEPQLQEDTYVFCRIERPGRPAGLTPRLAFEEPEGTTVVVRADEAATLGLAAHFPCQWIVLGAASDLHAIGFLAAVTARLAAAGIPGNVVSALAHDHLFVPAGSGRRAVEVLAALQREHQVGPS